MAIDRVSSPAERADGALSHALEGAKHRASRIRAASRTELVAQLSGAFDLAEGQPIGHAAQVAAVATAVAQRLDFSAAEQRTVRHAALLHDSGVAVRSLPDGTQPYGGHVATGAWVARVFGFDRAVREAILASHERWDGQGRPHGRAMAEIPQAALVVSAAHWLCDVADLAEQPLLVRARALRHRPDELAPLVGHDVAEALFATIRADALWMTFWSDDLPARLAASATGDGRRSVKAVEQAAIAMGQVIDAAVREHGRAERVAALAGALASTAGFSQAEQRALGVAARLLDIGQLSIPRHVLEKPDILTLQEMEAMREHPIAGARLVGGVKGFEEIAWWIECHHERPDGRGYPEMLERSEIPVPSRILSVADAYCALRAERPHRAALPPEEALTLIREAAGSQFDATVVSWLPEALALVGTQSLAPGPQHRYRASRTATQGR